MVDDPFGLFLLQHKTDGEGQELSSYLQKVPPPVKSAAAHGGMMAGPGRVTEQGNEERAQAVRRDSCSKSPSFPVKGDVSASSLLQFTLNKNTRRCHSASENGA